MLENVLASSGPSHIGLVVSSIDETMQYLSLTWGLGPWQVFEYSPKQEDLLMGKPFRQKVAHAKLGATEIELIQQLEGGGPWPEFLRARGEGLHHLGFLVSDYDGMVNKLSKRGGKLVTGGIFEGKRWCYFSTEPGGALVELMENDGV